jgi:hypothetical protein
MEKEELEKFVISGINKTQIGIIDNVNRNTIARRLKKFNICRETKKAHPNLKVNFFKSIDSKEKAYWLGFLYADGYISPTNSRAVIDLSEKDYNQVEKFCEVVGANKDKIRKRTHPCGSKSISIRITNKEFVRHIVDKGCINAKSKIINLPEFKDELLNLSFLSGYYDGDGDANSCELYCGCESFLNQIKIKYNIEFDVKKKERVFVLNLGADFKRKLINNYSECMERKKNTFKGDKRNKLNGINPNIERGIKIERFKITKDELEELIQKYPYTKIGEMFGVSGNSIKKRAKNMDYNLKIN